jgi:hypothetical protein
LIDPFQMVRMGRSQSVTDDRIVSGFAPETLYASQPLTELGTQVGMEEVFVASEDTRASNSLSEADRARRASSGRPSTPSRIASA